MAKYTTIARAIIRSTESDIGIVIPHAQRHAILAARTNWSDECIAWVISSL